MANKAFEKGCKESERPIVPASPGNHASWDPAEGRGCRATEPQVGKVPAAPAAVDVSTKQLRIAKRAQETRGAAIQTLSPFMDLEWLHEAHRRTRKDAAPGIDGTTAEAYAANLDDNLRDLLDRAKSGTYRAPPVRRVHIPKGDGKSTRPIGLPTFEDKILQRAVAMLLEPIYEGAFHDFSYGFRPGRSAHQALEALNQHLFGMRGGWVLEVDIRSFFDSLDHEKLRELLRQRVTDGVVVRLVGKWLRAGVLEDGCVMHPETGSPQGGVISPLLANIYLHEVLDEWWVRDVKPRMRGAAHLIRYADDFVMVFAEERDALAVQAVLPKRMARFGLTLHPDKTRLLDHRRPPKSGAGPRPGTVDFLGFTHFWGRSRNGIWIPKRKTASSRMRRSIAKVKEWLKRARHAPIAIQVKGLAAKLRGHFQYFGMRGNADRISRFRHAVLRLWRAALSRRSQRGSVRWEAIHEMLKRHPLPAARITNWCGSPV